MRIQLVNKLPLTDRKDLLIRALMTADLHIDDYGDPTMSNPKGKFAERIDVLADIISYAVSNAIGTIFVLGDFLHSRTKISIPVLHIVGDIIKDCIEEYGVKFVILKGNHDSYLKDENFHSLSNLPLCRVIDRVTAFSDLNIVAIPYGCEKSEVIDSKNKVFDANVLILMHTEFLGAINNEYKVMKSDMDPKRFTGETGVISGHYHTPQFVTENVFYLGAPIQQNFGERNNKPCFYDCLLYKDRILLKPILTDTPKYFYLDYDEIYNKDRDFDPSVYNGNYLRVFARKETYNKAMEMFSRDNLSFKNIEIVEKEISPAAASISFEENQREDAIERFLKYKKISEGLLSDYKKIGKELLDESQA